jgi:signal transduction histidine kinase/CheY-like chemotaxis protein
MFTSADNTPQNNIAPAPWKLILLTSTLVIGGLLSCGLYILQLESDLVRSIALDDAKRYTAALKEFRTLYTSEVVDRALSKDIKVSHDYLEHPGAIPLPATFSMLLGSQIEQHSGVGARLYSAHPFPWRKETGGPKDGFEQEALNKLINAPEEPFYQFQEDNQPQLRYAIADRMREDCINCHNTHPDSPKRDWMTGDARGVLAISIPLSNATSQARNALRGVFALSFMLAGSVLIFLLVFSFHLHNVAKVTQQNNTALNSEISQREKAEAERQAIQLQMFHAQKLESLGLLAGGIAHDFNNLLQGISGHTQLADLKIKQNQSPQKNINQVIKAVERASELTQQLLTYVGKNLVEKKEVDLCSLIEEMRPLISTMVRGIDIQYNLSTKPLFVNGEPSQLRQIVLNLLMNAADAVQNNKGTIEVITKIAENSDNISHPHWFSKHQVVLLKVQDTGMGMSKETLNKAFDPFFTTKSHGRGLGLAALQGIIRGHNGFMKVKSELGEGTTCQILLPLAQTENSLSVLSTPTKISSPKTLNKIILLVEDLSYVREVMLEVLTAQGYSVLAVSGGKQAIKQLRNTKVKNKNVNIDMIVILDVIMPEMNGYETFLQLRELDPHIPIIFTSGHTNTAPIENLLHKENVQFLSKPYTIPELLACLENTLT